MHTKYLLSCLLAILSYICIVDGLQPDRFTELPDKEDGQHSIQNSYERLHAKAPQSMQELENLKSDLLFLDELRNDGVTDMYDNRLDSGDVADAAVRKRPFCNGFTGCGRIGKRSSLFLDKLLLPNQEPVGVIAKRPFCNGFFGCGNPGKRLVFRNAKIVNRNIFSGPPKILGQKRFFCNPGAFGCSNQGKRSPVVSWLERLRTRIPGLISETK